jgi:hypothetical protein
MCFGFPDTYPLLIQDDIRVRALLVKARVQVSCHIRVISLQPESFVRFESPESILGVPVTFVTDPIDDSG